MVKTLAIETSCDDTSLSIVSFDGQRFTNEKMTAYSQISNHQKYWWVVPELASRLHSEKIIHLLEDIWLDQINDVDFFSITASPGLPWSLIVGISSGYMLWNFLSKPMIEVNHISWHLFSIFVDRNMEEIQFPIAVLSASWWHNEIYIVNRNKFDFPITKLWQTLDDAAWESFDKVARFLWWSYPWWPWISQKALLGKPNDLVKFSRIFLKADEFNFSFSWMKSQVYYLLKTLEKQNISLTDELINDICYEFQEAVVEVLANKLIKAAKLYEVKSICIVWWVSASDRLFEYTISQRDKKLNKEIEVFRPVAKKYSMDNGAMIWVAWIMNFLNK